MLLANAGVSVPADMVRFDSDASLLNAGEARLTVMVYVCTVVPSCAVTSTVIVFGPTTSGIPADAAPLATAVLLTLIVAFASAAVGVTVTDASRWTRHRCSRASSR